MSTRVRCVIQGTDNGIGLITFLTVATNSQRILRALDAVISRSGRGVLDWYVTDLRKGSLVLEMEARYRDTEAAQRDEVAPLVGRAFVQGMELIQREVMTPPYWSDRELEFMGRIARTLHQNGATGLQFTDMEQTVGIGGETAGNVDQLLRVHYKSIGSVEGTLETIALHKRPRFIVYQSLTGRAVTCAFDPASELFEQAKNALLKRVNVSGEVSYNLRGEPIRVNVEEIRILGGPQQLPRISDLSGSDPEFAGKWKTEEYLRMVRDA